MENYSPKLNETYGEYESRTIDILTREEWFALSKSIRIKIQGTLKPLLLERSKLMGSNFITSEVLKNIERIKQQEIN